MPYTCFTQRRSTDHLQERQFFNGFRFDFFNLRRRCRWYIIKDYLLGLFRLLIFFILFAYRLKDRLKRSLNYGIDLSFDDFEIDLFRLVLFHPIRILLPCSQPFIRHLLLEDCAKAFLQTVEFNLILFDQDSASARQLLFSLSDKVSFSF